MGFLKLEIFNLRNIILVFQTRERNIIMASCIFFVNQKGEEVVSRHYRSDVSKIVIDLFRSKVIRGD